MQKPAELVVMSWKGGWGRALERAVCEPFREATGIFVRQRDHVGLELSPELCAALAERRRPPVDVVWSNAVPALWAADLGHAEPLEEASSRPGLSARARPVGSAARSVVFPYVVYYVLVRGPGREGPPPRSWQALLAPEHRGKLALYPGGNGLLPIAQVMGGGALADIPRAMEPCWSFIRQLSGQVGQLDYSIGMERLLQTGRLSLCFRALPNALAFRAAGVDVDYCVPEEGTSDTCDALWVPRGLPEPERHWAQKLVAFALRPSVQEHLCGLLGCMPVHQSARPPAVILEQPRLPDDPEDVDTVLHVPDQVKYEHAQAWAQRFDRELAPGSCARSSSKPPASQMR